MAASIWSTYLAGPAAEFAAALTRPQFPAGLSAGVRLTLLGDWERVVDAAEIAQAIAAGAISWEADYTHLAFEADPQTAAAERALEDARDALRDYDTALSRARETTLLAA
jgi:hypothetical protein